MFSFIFLDGRQTRGMEHARCPACLQHPNETHGVAQPCPRGFAPVLTGAIWAAAAELLPAVRQLADRYNAQGTRRRFTGKERRRRCRRFTAARSRLSKLATPSMRTLRRSWTRETSPPLLYRALFAPAGTAHCKYISLHLSYRQPGVQPSPSLSEIVLDFGTCEVMNNMQYVIWRYDSPAMGVRGGAHLRGADRRLSLSPCSSGCATLDEAYGLGRGVGRGG